jgi:hypothetical protein
MSTVGERLKVISGLASGTVGQMLRAAGKVGSTVGELLKAYSGLGSGHTVAEHLLVDRVVTPICYDVNIGQWQPRERHHKRRISVARRMLLLG